MIITRTQFLDMTSLDGATLDIWMQEECILPEGEPDQPVFSDMDLARARLIRDLTGDMGVNPEGVGIILHLMDQIYALRGVVRANRRVGQD